MALSNEQSGNISARWGLLLCCVMVLVCYSNTFEASWHMDDFPNIVTNRRLKPETLSIDTLSQAFSARPTATPLDKEIWRPLPCLSFALNHYWGGDDVTGYHVVNLMIHLITTIFLFLAVRLLLQTPLFKHRLLPWEIHFTALLATLFWALNPVQIQAVTYIVQRMAAMAGMFTIVGLYAYLQGRLHVGRTRWWWYAATVLAFGSAMMSKENAVLFPLSTMLIEWVFFTSPQSRQRVMSILSGRRFIAAAILVFIAAAIFLLQMGLPINWSLYETRPFTMWQRLISEPRVLIFYLSLLFYPTPWRLSIEHPINHSLNLLTPWTTIPSILAVLGLVALGFFLVRKRPLISFAILFFFTNHMVESTILPLELVFEHRNYIPSFFIFLPIAFLVTQLLKRYRKEKKSIFIVLTFGLTIIIAALGYGCYERNKVWKSDYNLWYDALLKAPGRARPLMALGAAIGWGEENIMGGYDITIGVLEHALSRPGARIDYAPQIHQNMALAYMNMGQREKAFEQFEKALAERPQSRKYRFDYIEALVKYGEWDKALDQLDFFDPNSPYRVDDLNYKALIYLWMGRPEAALDLARQSLAAGSRQSFTYHLIGAAMTNLQYFEKGRWFLDRALETVEGQSRGKMMVYYTLAENRNAIKDEIGERDAIYRLLAEYGLDDIVIVLKNLNRTHSTPPINIGVVAQSLSRHLSEIAANIPEEVERASYMNKN